MTTYKVCTQRISRYGDNQWIFVAPSGKAYRFAIAGTVFKWSDANQLYCHVATVVDAGADGLLRIDGRTAKPLTLKAGETYLTVAQHPRLSHGLEDPAPSRLTKRRWAGDYANRPAPVSIQSLVKEGIDTMSITQKHHNIGYALYMGGQPITACQSNEQRRGWHNAQFGEMAAAEAETATYLSKMAVR